MDEKKLYQQKYEAQLDEWKADVAKLRAKASAADANAKLTLIRHVEKLEAKLAEAQSKVSDLNETREDKWEAAKARAEAAWTSLKSGFREAAAKLRD